MSQVAHHIQSDITTPLYSHPSANATSSTPSKYKREIAALKKQLQDQALQMSALQQQYQPSPYHLYQNYFHQHNFQQGGG